MKRFIPKRLFKFLFSGGAAALIELSIFLLLKHEGATTVLANSMSFIAGLLVSFTLNRTWVFRSVGNKTREIAAFVLLALFNLLLSNILLFISVDVIGIKSAVAKFVSMVVIAGWNYYIFPKAVFRKYSSHD